MHRALQIHEVVEEICSHVVPNQPGRRTLASLARTATLFQDPALNILWRWQGTFAHILRCMPEDLWNVLVREGSVNILDLTREISDTDWQRPLFYLRRVKTLHCSSRGDFPSPGVFESLRSCLPAGYLFPNLRSLTWTHNQIPVAYPYIYSVFGSRITRLDTSIPSTISHLSFIRTIASKCPDLTDVEIRFRETSDEPEFTGQQRTSMSLFVCGLRRIEKLKFVGSLDVLDQAAFEHLATLSTLKSLNAERLHDFTPFKSSHFSDTPGFLGLRSLKILVTTFEVVKFIKFLYGAPLADIEMIIRSSTTPPELFRAIAESVPPMALRSLTMSIIHSRLDRMPPVALQGGRVVHGGLPQLFCFYNITTVDLFLPDELDLDDVFVFQMARAWPHLRSLKLRLYPESGFADDSLITLAVYPVFAHHCPELRSLDIEISALVIPLTDYDSTPHQAIPSKVAWLDVGTAPIDDPSAVASLIFTVFPAVSEIRTGWKNSVRWSRDELDRFRARWKEVEKALTQKRRTSSS